MSEALAFRGISDCSFYISSSTFDVFRLNIEEILPEMSAMSTSANGNDMKARIGSCCLMS